MRRRKLCSGAAPAEKKGVAAAIATARQQHAILACVVGANCFSYAAGTDCFSSAAETDDLAKSLVTRERGSSY